MNEKTRYKGRSVTGSYDHGPTAPIVALSASCVVLVLLIALAAGCSTLQSERVDDEWTAWGWGEQ